MITPTHLWRSAVPTVGAGAAEGFKEKLLFLPFKTKILKQHQYKTSTSEAKKGQTRQSESFPVLYMPQYILKHQEREPEAQWASR